jgi:uncharacterized protein
VLSKLAQPVASRSLYDFFMTPTDSLKALVLRIARHLVDRGDEVIVDAIEDGEKITIRLEVGPGDVGKIIGKQGRTARSLRAIISAASMKMKHRVSLDIVEI